MFCQAKMSVSRKKANKSLFKKEPHGLDTFQVGDGGVTGLSIRDKNETMGLWKLIVIE